MTVLLKDLGELRTSLSYVDDYTLRLRERAFVVTSLP